MWLGTLEISETIRQIKIPTKKSNKSWREQPTNIKLRKERVELSRPRIEHTHLMHSHIMKKGPPIECDECESYNFTIRNKASLKGVLSNIPSDNRNLLELLHTM